MAASIVSTGFFYWGDVLSILLLPALFLHFALVFPERSQRWTGSGVGRVLVPLIYVPALLLGAARVVALARSGANAPLFVGVVAMLDRLEYVYLVGCFVAGLFTLTRALAEVRSITARRQLRWIAWGTALGAAPFVCGYALPWAMGVEPSLPMQLSAIPLSFIPLAYASAIVRYPAVGRGGDSSSAPLSTRRRWRQLSPSTPCCCRVSAASFPSATPETAGCSPPWSR